VANRAARESAIAARGTAGRVASPDTRRGEMLGKRHPTLRAGGTRDRREVEAGRDAAGREVATRGVAGSCHRGAARLGIEPEFPVRAPIGAGMP
jgi:hypothetical protein